MPLPKIEHEHIATEIAGVGTLHIRPLTRGEFRAVEHEAQSDPLGAQLSAVALAIQVDEGEDVRGWFDNLPAKSSSAVFDAVVAVSVGTDDAEGALGN